MIQRGFELKREAHTSVWSSWAFLVDGRGDVGDRHGDDRCKHACCCAESFRDGRDDDASSLGPRMCMIIYELRGVLLLCLSRWRQFSVSEKLQADSTFSLTTNFHAVFPIQTMPLCAIACDSQRACLWRVWCLCRRDCTRRNAIAFSFGTWDWDVRFRSARVLKVLSIRIFILIVPFLHVAAAFYVIHAFKSCSAGICLSVMSLSVMSQSLCCCVFVQGVKCWRLLRLSRVSKMKSKYLSCSTCVEAFQWSLCACVLVFTCS